MYTELAERDVVELEEEIRRYDPEVRIERDNTPGGDGRAVMKGLNWHVYFDGTMKDFISSLDYRKSNLDRIADEMDAPLVPDPNFPLDIRDSSRRLGFVRELAVQVQERHKSPIANKIRDLKERHNGCSKTAKAFERGSSIER